MLNTWKNLKKSLRIRMSRIHPWGFKGENLYVVGYYFYSSLRSGKIGSRAASVSFRFLQAFFPMVVTIFTLIPFVPIDHFQEDVMELIRSLFPPEVYGFFESALLDLIVQKRGVLLSIGFLITLYFASNGIDSLLAAFGGSTHLTQKQKLYKRKLWSVAVLFILLVLGALEGAFSFFGNLSIEFLHRNNWIGSGLSYYLLVFLKILIEVLLAYTIITLLYNIGNFEKRKFEYFSAGATAAVLLILLLQRFFSFYLSYFAKFDKLYGPLGAAIGFLLFIYYLFFLLIIGFELNASIHSAKKRNKAA